MNNKSDFLYTPGGINLGFPYYKDNGKLYLEVKQGKKKEEVPWDFLTDSIYKKAKRKAENP